MRITHSKLWLAVMMAACVNFEAKAGITTDTSLGQASQTLSGNMTITQAMGSLQGNNLFHSFQAFNINTGESANFTTTSSGIANVISRVTGGSASAINGALTLTPVSGAPNFFFINPAGVTFGAGASVNVPGAFHVSTADYVKFADGNYYADLSKASTLSVATPDAFGFLGNSRASITLNGAASLSNNNQAISIVAGDITLDSGTVSTLSGGDIRVAAVGQTAVEVPFTGTLPAAYGDLNILNGGNISADTATAATAGSVYVSAGAINIDGNGVFDAGYLASTLGISSTNFSTIADGAVGNVNVKASGAISLTNGAVISADSYSGGIAGNVTVTAGSISIDGGGFINAGNYYSSRISSISNGSGDAGAVSVTANGNLNIINDGDITADSSVSANAGAVTVNAGSITIDGYGNSFGFTGIASSVWGATGNGGAISVTSAGNISLVNNGQIVSFTRGAGDTGSVSVNAASLSVDGFNAGISTDTFAGGNAGSVNITTSGNISLSNSGYLRSTSQATASGNAGSVNIATTGNLSINNGGDLFSDCYASGNAGSINIIAGSITIDGQGNTGFTGITSGAHSGSTGAAGIVNITTSGNIALSNTGQISTSTFGAGNAGAINIHASNISIDGNNATSLTTFTGISSGAIAGTGNAGNVNITTTGTLALLGTGQIYSDTFTSGSAGSISINAATLLIDGAANGYTSGLLAKAKNASNGQTGNIDVTANAITISNGGQISIQNDATASNPALLTPTTISVTAPRITILNSMNAITAASTGNVDAGNIVITASDTLSLDPSGITTTANLGNGGAISITAGILALNSSEITTSVTGATGNGGNISISAKTLLLNTGFIQANTAAANASGGTITIAAQNLLPSGNVLFIGGNTPYAFRSDVFGFNVIQAAAPTGISGSPQTTAPTLDLAASMSGLNTQQIDTGGLGRSPCQSTGGSSLAAAGRGGLARGLLRAEQPLPTNKTSYIPQANVLDRQLALTEWSCS